MKIFSAKNPLRLSETDSNIYTFARLLKSLGIASNRRSIYYQLYTHPTPHSLQAFKDALPYWGVEAMVIKLEQTDALLNADFSGSAVAHIIENQQPLFITLTEINEKFITCRHPRKGEITFTKEEFQDLWTGYLLVAQSTTKAEEPHYLIKKLASYWVPGLILLFVILLGQGLISTPISLSAQGLLIGKLAGFWITTYLVQKQLNLGSNRSQGGLSNLCKWGNQDHCHTVLHSAQSKLAGLISWALIGHLYFLGSLILITLGLLTHHLATSLTLLIYLNLFTLPYTFFSVYYQARVLHSWCLYCLVIQSIFWLEFGLLLSLDNFTQWQLVKWSSDFLWLSIIAFMIPAVLWIGVYSYLKESGKVHLLKKTLRAFKYNESFFLNTVIPKLSQAKHTTLSDSLLPHNELEEGNPRAPIILTLVLSPFCPYCDEMYQKIQNLFLSSNKYAGQILVRYRLPTNEQTPSAIFVQHLLKLSLSEQPALAIEALKGWYKQKGKNKNIRYWQDRYPLSLVTDTEASIDLTTIQSLMAAHNKWCKERKVRAIPTLFINEIRLPAPYQLEDVYYHLDTLLKYAPKPQIISLVE